LWWASAQSSLVALAHSRVQGPALLRPVHSPFLGFAFAESTMSSELLFVELMIEELPTLVRLDHRQ